MKHRGRRFIEAAKERLKGRAEPVMGGGARFSKPGQHFVGFMVLGLLFASWLLAVSNDVQAQRLLQISGARRTVSVTVPIGKTEDVRVDSPFTDVTVGDPEVADVAPMTDHSLSILGRKIGTTRVSVYAE